MTLFNLMMKFVNKHKNYVFLLIISTVSLPIFVFAAGSVNFENPLGTASFQGLITKFLDAIFSIVGLVSVVMIVYGGFLYMISGGEDKKLEQAKKTITYAIIGLVIVILSYSILNFIVTALGG